MPVTFCTQATVHRRPRSRPGRNREPGGASRPALVCVLRESGRAAGASSLERASTHSGSNCVPACARSSPGPRLGDRGAVGPAARASRRRRPRRAGCGRRAGSPRRSGRPGSRAPSKRSSEWRIQGTIVSSPWMRETISAPRTGFCLIASHSRSVSGCACAGCGRGSTPCRRRGGSRPSGAARCHGAGQPSRPRSRRAYSATFHECSCCTAMRSSTARASAVAQLSSFARSA